MPNEPLFRFLNDTARKSRLTSLREAVRPILANNLQTEFTDHTCDHSDEVARLVDKLIAPLQSTENKLSDQELFALYAACYTHDFGMQYEQAGVTAVAREAGAGEGWHRLSREERGKFLRDNHHKISAELVMQSVRNASPPLGISLGDGDDPALIAALSVAHGLEADSLEYQDLMDGGGPAVRMDLLSGLLRMGDILEESRRRAARPKADTLLLPLLSQAHWWRHYYTREVDFNPSSKTITLVFDFPVPRREEYARIVPQLHVPNILKELHRHEAAFARNGVIWVVTPEIERGVYSAAQDMPADVEAMMLGMLKNEADREAAEHRQHLVGVFEQARPLLARLLDENAALPPTTPAAEKAYSLETVAAQFHQVGALNGEASVLQTAYHLYEQAGDTQRQLASGLRLIGLLMAAHPDAHIYQIIQECERIAEATAVTSEQRLTLSVHKARLFNGVGAYPEMADAYRVAIEAATSNTQQGLADDLVAELAEAQFLLGDTEEAAQATDELLGRARILPLADASGKPSPTARAVAVVARLEARSGDVSGALARLDHFSTDVTGSPAGIFTRALLQNARAQILFLTGASDAAAEILSTALNDVTLAGHPRLRVALERNRRSCFTMASLAERLRQHDEVRDAADVSGYGAEYALSLLAALDEQREGKHPEALPRFWRELGESYRSEEWQRYWEAEAYFSLEHATMASFDNSFGYAAFHAIQALSEPLVQDIGNNLLAMRQAEPIRDTLLYVLHSKLRLHVIPACQLIGTLADAIPGDLVLALLEFLLPFATTELQFLAQTDVSRPAWQTLKALVPRLSPDQATALMAHISGLDLTNASDFLLQHILETVQRLAAVLPPEELAAAARVALPHAVGYPQNQDHQIYYGNALGALHQIVVRSDETVKDFIGQGLFPPGKQTVDPGKLLLLPLFREGMVETPWANEFAAGVAQTIRRQVQVYEAGENEADPQLAVVMYQIRELEEGRRRVSRVLGMPELRAAAAYIGLLTSECLEELLGACLEMVATPYNFMSNRIEIIQVLSTFADRLSEEQQDRVRQTLLFLAQGKGVSDEDRQMARAAQDPLNRFVMKMGNPVDLQGMALRALTHLTQANLEAPQDAILELLQRSIVSPDPALRREAAYATLDLPQINEKLVTALLCGLRDPLPEMAEACYWSLAQKQSIELNDFLAGLMVTSLQLALQNPNIRVRRGAAALSSRLRAWLPAEGLYASVLDQVQQELAKDICHSVRVQIVLDAGKDEKASSKGAEIPAQAPV